MKRMFLILIFSAFPLILLSQKESFNTFISTFSQDSLFQISRIEFPLTYVTWDYEKDEEIEIKLQQKNWKYDALYFNMENTNDAFTVFYDNFECKFKEDTEEMVFQWKGFYSVDRRYYFKRIENQWYLVKILDYDPIE